MGQQEALHGQISQKVTSSEASKEEVYVPSPLPTQESLEFSEIPKEEDLQHAIVLPEYAPFPPFHQPQNQHRPLEAAKPHISLSLSLERSDTYGSAACREAPVRPQFARAPFDADRPILHADDRQPHGVGRLDLEQRPFPSTEETSRGSYGMNAGNTQGEGYQKHQNMEFVVGVGAHQQIYQAPQGMQASSFDSSFEQATDGTRSQLVAASDHPSHDQSIEQQYYPPPSATHNAVIQDPELFMTTLDNFLTALGTKLTMPKVGGLDLDLHTFYSEVTACGGLAQMIRLGRWKELSQALGIKFSLSMPYVLRKHYTSLLFHYEQVYFFRTEGQLVAPPVPLPAPNPVEPVAEAVSPYEPPTEILSMMKKRKRKLDAIEVFGVDPASAIGTMVTGAISGKTEEGYFVTVVVGTEKLNGVIYHVSSDGENNQFASIPSLLDGIGSEENTAGLEVQLYGKIRREPIRKRNPNGPKRTRTGYHIFYKEQREKLSQLYPETKGLGKKVIEMWGKLPENEKAPYIARGNQERERYLTEFNEQMKSQPHSAEPAVNACGNEQLGEHDHGAYYVSHDYHVSLEPEGDLPSEHPQMPEVDQVYHAYHHTGPLSHPPNTEMPGDHLISEQTYDIQEEEADYNQEPASDEDEDEEDADAELEENFEGEEDEMAYPPENAYEEQDGGDYQASEKKYSMQEGPYAFPQNESRPPEPRPHGASITPKRPHYGQDHAYMYGSPMPQPMVGSQGSLPLKLMRQSPYQMQENGKVVYPRMQPVHSEASGDPMIPQQQQCFAHDRYVYAVGKRELTMPREQAGAFHRQKDLPSYPAPLFHQNPVMMPGIRMQQLLPEQAYQERYAYPMHLPHAQMYGVPPTQGYPVRFPHAPYPIPWSDSQAMMQYNHPYAPQIHQPQVSVPEVSRVTPASQVYPVHDGGPNYQTS